MPPLINVWNLGRVSFDTAFQIQTILARRILDTINTDEVKKLNTLLITEHKPVYTVGIRDQMRPIDIVRLESLGAEFRKTNRGGLITFHGPGQLVVYPILHLKQFEPSMKTYIHMLEESIIRMCAVMGIKAERSIHTGVWVDDNKLAAIGVHASRYVTTHGIAINCDTDLSWFEHIVPCGIPDKGVTSLTEILGEPHTVDAVLPKFLKSFQGVFGARFERMGDNDVVSVLKKAFKDVVSQAS